MDGIKYFLMFPILWSSPRIMVFLLTTFVDNIYMRRQGKYVCRPEHWRVYGKIPPHNHRKIKGIQGGIKVFKWILPKTVKTWGMETIDTKMSVLPLDIT